MKKYYSHTVKLSDACGGLGYFNGFFMLNYANRKNNIRS